MNEIDKMLETAIEIEGLIRIIRDREPQEETYELLRRKIWELGGCLPPAPSHKEGEECFGGSDTVNVSTRESEETENLRNAIPESAVDMEKEADVRMEEAEAVEIEAAKEAAYDDDILLSFEDDENESATTDLEKDSAITDLEKEIKPSKRNLKAGFSLNDRFLYARELFDNNMKAFDSTLKSLEGVKDFSVIEDYFYNELDWDSENPIVKEFMERLKG